MAGAQVVFVDIDPTSYTIDVERIEEKITSKTKAIIPVHLYGRPADMDPILALAKKHGLFVVGDAAQAHGALYKGQPVSTLADITCFSFYPGKNLGAYGDGGALVTDNEAWAARAAMFANHGRTDTYDHAVEGVNSRLDGIQAASPRRRRAGRRAGGSLSQRTRRAPRQRIPLAAQGWELPLGVLAWLGGARRTRPAQAGCRRSSARLACRSCRRARRSRPEGSPGTGRPCRS